MIIRMTARYQRVRRVLTLEKKLTRACKGLRRFIDISYSLSRWRGQAVANAANGCQQLDLKGVINFASQTAHIDINHVRAPFKIVVPYVLLDHIAGNNLVGMIH